MKLEFNYKIQVINLQFVALETCFFIFCHQIQKAVSIILHKKLLSTNPEKFHPEK